MTRSRATETANRPGAKVTGVKTAGVKTDPAIFPDPFVYLEEGAGPLTPRQIGLVPGQDIPVLPVDLPPGLRGYAREQVAARQLGDALAVRPGDFEIRPFHSPGKQRSWERVLLAEAGQMGQWRTLAGASGKAVIPDYLALPAEEKVWSLAIRGETVLARLGTEDGFSAPLPVAVHLLRGALQRDGTVPEAVFCLSALPADIETLFSDRDIPVADTTEALQALGISAPRSLAHGELNFDLRRDPRAARVQLAKRVLPWRWPVLAGLLAAGLWAGAQLLATDDLRGKTEQLRMATLEVVRSDFVPSGPILDIRTQVSRALAEARVAAAGADTPVSPLDILGLTAEVAAGAAAQPDMLNYTAGDGLNAVFRVTNFAAAEGLADALRNAGLEVSVVESRVSGADEGVRTELFVTRREVSQ